MASWEDIDENTWLVIFLNLHAISDRMTFRSVCRLFRLVSSIKQSYKLSRALLILPAQEDTEWRQFFSLSDRSTYKTYIPELRGKSVRGSAFGWLFGVDFKSLEIELVNPITRATIKLPPLHTIDTGTPPADPEMHAWDDPWFIHKATISWNPVRDREYVVMVIASGSLGFCKIGDDSWTHLVSDEDVNHGNCADVLYHKGKFFVYTDWGTLLSWDLSDANEPKERIIITQDKEIQCDIYLVESIHGELLLVRRIKDDKDKPNTLSFTFCKLDEERGAWVHKEARGSCWLQGQALFLGYNRAICLSTLQNSECREYGIYFTDDARIGYAETEFGLNDVGLYDLKEGTRGKFYESFPFWSDPCFWVTPTLQ